MNKSYRFTENRNLTPNIRKQANSRRIDKSLTAAAGSKQQIFCARGVPKYCHMSILYGQKVSSIPSELKNLNKK